VIPALEAVAAARDAVFSYTGGPRLPAFWSLCRDIEVR
jgi:hypothetical protein